MIRIVLTKPKKKHHPINGLVMYNEGRIVSQVVLQERPNRTSKWMDVPILTQLEIEE